MLNRQLLQLTLRVVDTLNGGGDTLGKRLVFQHGGGKFQIADMDFFTQARAAFSANFFLDFGEFLILLRRDADLFVQPNGASIWL
jgi:hypothetical protein